MSAALVKELRERTGLGLMECKKALSEAGDDIDAAIEALRKSSGMKAAKKAGRTAADGVVAMQTADDGSFAAMVEVNSETDFVARDDNFLNFVRSVVGKAYEERIDDVRAHEAEMDAKALERHAVRANEGGRGRMRDAEDRDLDRSESAFSTRRR